MFDAELSMLLRQSNNSQYTVGGKTKRVFDVLVAIATLIAALPLFFCVFIALKLTDPGPVFYHHVRVGRGGRRFPCIKFRSMVVNSDEVLKSVLENDPERRDEWMRTQKLINDPRITPMGQFLRQSSLDELPQLLNVIRGDMSLVGPRPIVPAEMPRYGDKLDLYLQARPGITGIWQISGRNDCEYKKRIEMDANYVRHWSFAADISILIRTFVAVLTRKGSY
ncbi:exopolysaccharide biosynthesis protein [Beijerinckiaceae bacterium]|nr:exopolysaccharide biosynthesis protein [Beijerinckiaceae bacterium]